MKQIRRFSSVAIVLTAYCLLSYVKNSPSIPSLIKLGEAGFKIYNTSKFYDNALYTMKIVSIGIGISLVFGLILAVMCSVSKIAESLIMPIINTVKNIPSIALFPVFIVIMGIGDLPRVFVIIWNSAYPIISSTISGLNSIDKDIIGAAENAGANEFQMYLHIRLPLALVRILEGLKISISNGFIAIVVAEMLGATKGLGYMIVWSSNAFKYPDMYIYIFSIAMIGFIVNHMTERIIRLVERNLYS